jgi:glycosyltransferase involved in cell wall biosynthesis
MVAAKILVFIPMYKCAAQIPRVIAQLDEASFELIDKVILVDNGSPDGTIDAARAALASWPIDRYAILRNRQNYSLGGSHKVAFNYALDHGYSHVIVFHGDDQGNIQDLWGPIRAGDHQRYDCLLGARFMKGSSLKGYSPFRIFANYISNGLFSIATQRVITDLGSGLNLYAMLALASRRYLRYSDTLNFNHFMLLGSIAAGDRVRFVPISWREEDQVSNVQLTRFARLTMMVLLSYVFARRSLLERDHSARRDGIYEFDLMAGQEG